MRAAFRSNDDAAFTDATCVITGKSLHGYTYPVSIPSLGQLQSCDTFDALQACLGSHAFSSLHSSSLSALVLAAQGCSAGVW